MALPSVSTCFPLVLYCSSLSSVVTYDGYGTGYMQTKWVGEHLVLQAAQRGFLRAIISRWGLCGRVCVWTGGDLHLVTIWWFLHWAMFKSWWQLVLITDTPAGHVNDTATGTMSAATRDCIANHQMKSLRQLTCPCWAHHCGLLVLSPGFQLRWLMPCQRYRLVGLLSQIPPKCLILYASIPVLVGVGFTYCSS